MLKEFKEDLGPWALKTVASLLVGALLTGLITEVVVPLFGGEPSELALHIAWGLFALGAGIGLGAWIQARRAPARMYRYSKQMSPIIKFLRDDSGPEEQVRSTIGAAGHLFQRESKSETAFALLRFTASGLVVDHTSAPETLQRRQRLPAGALHLLQHRSDLIREDNLKRQTAKQGSPQDYRELFDLGFQSLRAVPAEANGKAEAVLLLVSSKPRAFSAAEDRILLFLQELLAVVWSQPAPTSTEASSPSGS